MTLHLVPDDEEITTEPLPVLILRPQSRLTPVQLAALFNVPFKGDVR